MPDKKLNRAVIDVDAQLLGDISDLIESKSNTLLKNILADIYPADIALIIENLTEEEGLAAFLLLDEETSANTLLELSDHYRDYMLDHLSTVKSLTLSGKWIPMTLLIL